MGVISFRAYLVIAFIVAAVIYLLGLVADDNIVAFLLDIRGDATRAGMASVITNFVIEPLRLIFSGDLPGAIVGGILWPLLAVWGILFVLVAIFSFVGPGMGEAAGAISN